MKLQDPTKKPAGRASNDAPIVALAGLRCSSPRYERTRLARRDRDLTWLFASAPPLHSSRSQKQMTGISMENGLSAPDSTPETPTLSSVRSAVLATRLRAAGLDQSPTAVILYEGELAWSTMGRPEFEIRRLHNSRGDLNSDLGPITRSKVLSLAACSSCLRRMDHRLEEQSSGRECGRASKWLAALWSRVVLHRSSRCNAHRIVLRRPQCTHPGPLAMPKEVIEDRTRRALPFARRTLVVPSPSQSLPLLLVPSRPRSMLLTVHWPPFSCYSHTPLLLPRPPPSPPALRLDVVSR
jgi:hypothetical protein